MQFLPVCLDMGAFELLGRPLRLRVAFRFLENCSLFAATLAWTRIYSNSFL